MTSATARTGLGVRGWSPARAFALVSAVVYLAAGLIGFAITGFDAPFLGLADTRVVILAVNPAHNVVHVVLGLAYLAGVTNDRYARYAGISIGVGLLGAFVLGVLGGAEFLNIDGVAEPDNWLHLIWGGASVWIGRLSTPRSHPGRRLV